MNYKDFIKTKLGWFLVFICLTGTGWSSDLEQLSQAEQEDLLSNMEFFEQMEILDNLDLIEQWELLSDSVNESEVNADG